jgi:hypothetical protein
MSTLNSNPLSEEERLLLELDEYLHSPESIWRVEVMARMDLGRYVQCRRRGVGVEDSIHRVLDLGDVLW